MHRQFAIIASTHVDRHNERIAPSALSGIAKQIESHYVRMMWNHDIRLPTLGRAVAARVVPLADGELGLEVESEVWEVGDTLEGLRGDGRSIVQQLFDEPGIEVRVDRGLAAEDWDLIYGIARLDGHDREPVEVGKKALEPDAVIVLATGSIAGAIGIGFLQRLGEDLYEQLKQRLVDYVRNKRTANVLFDFDITFERDGAKVLHVLLENPTDDDIVALFDSNFEGVETIVESALSAAEEIVELVLTWREGAMILNYGLRRDGVPILQGRGIPDVEPPG